MPSADSSHCLTHTHTHTSVLPGQFMGGELFPLCSSLGNSRLASQATTCLSRCPWISMMPTLCLFWGGSSFDFRDSSGFNSHPQHLPAEWNWTSHTLLMLTLLLCKMESSANISACMHHPSSAFLFFFDWITRAFLLSWWKCHILFYEFLGGVFLFGNKSHP
jgi:hypothetical protein